jgi:hypothetical protein
MKRKIVTAVFFFLPACLMASTLIVSGDANIFGAGHASPPPAPDNAWTGSNSGAGSLPLSVSFPAGANQILTFSSVTGTASCCGTGDPNEPPNGPDGRPGVGTDVNSAEGIAGIQYPGQRMFLVGVFLDDSEPSDPAPAKLSFTSPNNVAEFSPGMRQVFFVGDGLMADETTRQIFNVPTGATRFYLGFADGAFFMGNPGYYSDDSGQMTATFNITGTSVPEPASASLTIIGLGLVAGYAFRRQLS